MPIYKMDGKKDGLQKYRVRINYIDSSGKARQLDRVAYGMDNAKTLERQLNMDRKEITRKRFTVEELYEEYINVKKSEIRETSLNISIFLLDKYVMPYLGKIRIDKLNTVNLQGWKRNIDEQKKSNNEYLSLNYKKEIYTKFCAILNYAVKMEYIDKNYLSIVGNFKNAYKSKREINYYTPEEFLKFILVARNSADEYEEEKNSIYEWNYYVFFNIAFYTGMRKGEIFALKWTDIQGDVINITRSISQLLKGEYRETPPKNESSIRTIQIPKPLMDILKEHYERFCKISGFKDDWRICGGQKCISVSNVRNRCREYAESAGVKIIKVHDFRHSHASLLANNGINIQEIARRLGHAKVEMTWNTYSHLYPRENERAVEFLNQIV